MTIAGGEALHLFDNLSTHFGKDQIFMDIEQIEPGADFIQVIKEAVGACDVLIALIGRHWLTVTDGTARRLDNLNDFVRLEIAAALDRNVRVIPVLVQGATMPRQQDLPDEIKALSQRHAFELSHQRWKHDVSQLIGALEKVILSQRNAGTSETPSTNPSTSRAMRTQWQAMLASVAIAAGVISIIVLAMSAWRMRANENTNSSPVITVPKPTPQPTPTARQLVTSPEHFTNSIGIEFIWIPPGNFMMGSNDGDSDEKPVHQVIFNQGFYMGKYEVTQTQWQAVMGNNPSYFKGDNLPVEQVSWDDAVSFIAKLNERNDGYTYRLPSEAEWEYAARAGTTGNYAGDLDAMAWYEKNAGSKTHPVGSKQPNVFGLYDMYGNVWEWVQDWYHDSYAGAPIDGSAWLSIGEYKYRVLRGGSWNVITSNLRSAYRLITTRDYRDDLIGFRVVAVVRQ